jgi:hypothetical protein
MEDNGKELERILEEGISSYADGEPLAGLDERIMARVRMAVSPPRSVAGLWAALAVGLALAVSASVSRRMGSSEATPVRIVAETKTPTAEKTTTQSEALKVSVPRHRSSGVAGLPKRPVFPTPSPLTAEERRLLAMVRQDPEGTAQAFDSLRKRGNEALEIVPLVIPPLETGGGQ